MQSKPFFASSTIVTAIGAILGVVFILFPKVKDAFDASGLTVDSIGLTVGSVITLVAAVISIVKRLANKPQAPISGTPAASK